MKTKKLPMQLVLQLNSTNGTTMQKGVEAVVDVLKHFRFPKNRQVLKGDYWRVKVLDSVFTIDPAKRKRKPLVIR